MVELVNQIECGKIFLMIDRKLKFYCTICENKFYDFSNYKNHLDSHYITYKQNTAEPVNGIEDNKDNVIAVECKEEIEILPIEEENNINDQIITSKICRDEDVLKENEIELKEFKRRKRLKIKASIVGKDDILIKKRKYPRAKESPICPICKEVLSKNTHLKTHMKRHTDHKDYMCSHCPKKFFTRSELDTHVRSHTGERPYLCTECGAATTTKSKLSVHIRQKHSRERDKLCSICNMSFYSSVLLKNHMVTHSDERPFQCTLCESKFKRRKGLQSHLKSHENKKEFECDMCLAKFNQKCNLNSHRKKKHALAFSNKDSLSIF